MITLPPMCLGCKHYKNTPTEHWFKCTAFPESIPNDILFGIFDHRHKYPGDKGIKYEPVSKAALVEIDEKLSKAAEPCFEEFDKTWDDWSRFRKPKYDPANRKSVAACKRFARMGVIKPGCERATYLAENVYEPGKDDYQYIDPTPVDPRKFVSMDPNERKSEIDKKYALFRTDRLFDSAKLFRDQNGSIIVTNWSGIPPEDKETLSSMFDENGRLLDTKYREFDKRFKDYNSRRLARGDQENKIK